MSEKYIWYDTVKEQRVSKFRNEPYTVDGKPGVLPPNVVELRVIRVMEPIDLDTQMYTDVITVDLVSKKYIITKTPIAKPSPTSPYEVAPSALRMAMLDAGIDLDAVDTLIAATSDPTERKKIQIQWEYSTTIRRDHPLIISFGADLGLTENQIDTIFINAEENYA